MQDHLTADDHVTAEGFASLVDRPVSTIYYWRSRKIGPTGFRVGRRILYRRRDIEQWLDELHAAATRLDPPA